MTIVCATEPRDRHADAWVNVPHLVWVREGQERFQGLVEVQERYQVCLDGRSILSNQPEGPLAKNTSAAWRLHVYQSSSSWKRKCWLTINVKTPCFRCLECICNSNRNGRVTVAHSWCWDASLFFEKIHVIQRNLGVLAHTTPRFGICICDCDSEEGQQMHAVQLCTWGGNWAWPILGGRAQMPACSFRPSLLVSGKPLDPGSRTMSCRVTTLFAGYLGPLVPPPLVPLPLV